MLTLAIVFILMKTHVRVCVNAGIRINANHRIRIHIDITISTIVFNNCWPPWGSGGPWKLGPITNTNTNTNINTNTITNTKTNTNTNAIININMNANTNTTININSIGIRTCSTPTERLYAT